MHISCPYFDWFPMNIHITRRSALLILFDIVATYGSYWLASVLTNVTDEVFTSNEIFFMLGILTLFNLATLAIFRLYNNLWEYASVDEGLQIVVSLGISTFAGALFLWLIQVRLPIRVYFVSFFLLLIFSGGVRIAQRIVRTKKRIFSGSKHVENDEQQLRTLIIGAGETGSLTIARMSSADPLMPGKPICAVDDNIHKQGLRIHGIKVEGSSDDILDLVHSHRIEQIVVAIPSASLDERRRIYDICMKTDCKLRTLPNVRELRTDELEDISFRDVDVADLLGREEVVLNTRGVARYIVDTTVLVTGGGGSIGSELVRQISVIKPRRVVVFDMYENDAYLLKQDLSAQYPDIEYIVEIGNVCDKRRVKAVFDHYKPSVVFHAAAHKHVPLMEMCPREAVQNNVFGTLNVVEAADHFGVDRFIFISTDKAVNPSSVMGATKRMGEMIMQYYARSSKTVFSAVRFGNVLGSNGSVIPIFKQQIAEGGPVTVTHPDIERYFMTIPEAARLVIQAGGMARGGEIFILDMGSPVKIVDLAKGLIQLSGLIPDQDIRIVYTGLREGEKMYEELLMEEEQTLPTTHASIMISTGQEISHDEVAEKIALLEALMEGTDEEAIHILEQTIPTYTHTSYRS